MNNLVLCCKDVLFLRLMLVFIKGIEGFVVIVNDGNNVNKLIISFFIILLILLVMV